MLSKQSNQENAVKGNTKVQMSIMSISCKILFENTTKEFIDVKDF